MKKKVIAVTGIRSEYDILYPVLNVLRHDKLFDLGIVASGAHLSEWHNFTFRRIEEDGFRVADKLDSLLSTDRDVQRAKGTGLLIQALAQTIDRERPDLLLVVGDREESIATAIVGTYMNTLVAHIGGGDSVYGNTDDSMRFAVSKLAHIHLCMSKQSAHNLAAIGEEKFRIFDVGNPSLDNIRSTEKYSLKKISEFLSFNLENGQYVVLLYHPLSSEIESSFEQMQVILEALEEFCSKNGFKVVGIMPNTDPGAHEIINAIKKFEPHPFVRFFKTLPRDIFVNVMRHAKTLIGNSSMGLLEAPFYKLPVINVGNRQKGRLNAGNVEFVHHDSALIVKALGKACLDDRYRNKVGSIKNPFGDGHSAMRIKKVLASIDFENKGWYIKRGVS